MKLNNFHEAAGLIPGLAQWAGESGIAVSCGVGRRCGSDPMLLWLWRRPAATALIRPLAWEPPYASGAAQSNSKKTKKIVRDAGLSHFSIGPAVHGSLMLPQTLRDEMGSVPIL